MGTFIDTNKPTPTANEKINKSIEELLEIKKAILQELKEETGHDLDNNVIRYNLKESIDGITELVFMKRATLGSVEDVDIKKLSSDTPIGAMISLLAGVLLNKNIKDKKAFLRKIPFDSGDITALGEEVIPKLLGAGPPST